MYYKIILSYICRHPVAGRERIHATALPGALESRPMRGLFSLHENVSHRFLGSHGQSLAIETHRIRWAGYAVVAYLSYGKLCWAWVVTWTCDIDMWHWHVTHERGWLASTDYVGRTGSDVNDTLELDLWTPHSGFCSLKFWYIILEQCSVAVFLAVENC